MNKFWTIWKHALGSYNEEDGFDPKNDNPIAVIRTLILLINVVCAILIMANIIHNW